MNSHVEASIHFEFLPHYFWSHDTTKNSEVIDMEVSQLGSGVLKLASFRERSNPLSKKNIESKESLGRAITKQLNKKWQETFLLPWECHCRTNFFQNRGGGVRWTIRSALGDVAEIIGCECCLHIVEQSSGIAAARSGSSSNQGMRNSNEKITIRLQWC